MQKKIGILTFHNAVNYGAVLQAYALYHVIAAAGYKVEIIDYVNDEIEKELDRKGDIAINGFKSYLKSLLKKYHGYRKKQSFSNFLIHNMTLSKERNIQYDLLNKIANEYDVFISGSDQVWNLDLTDNDMAYFLDFAASDTKRIAYAVSGGDVINDNISFAIEHIKKFEYISVREPSLSEYLFNTLHIKNVVCCDPVILAGGDIFKKLIRRRFINEKYILCFLMCPKPGIINVARSIAKEKRLILIDNKSSYQFFLHSSPEDFLSWIYNAEYILTDSFHGTAFSVVFHKQFISDKYDGKGNLKKRIFDLLNELSLNNHFQNINLENEEMIKKYLYEAIDYDLIEKERFEFAEKSKNWLLEAIKSE